MLLPLTLLLELALHPVPVHVDADSTLLGAHAPTARGTSARLHDLVVARGTPIVAARDRAEFERVLWDAKSDPLLPGQVLDVLKIAFEDRHLPDLDPIVALYSQRLGEEHRWQIRQIFNMSLELMLQVPSLTTTSLEKMIEGLDTVEVAELELSDAFLENFVCAAAAVSVVENPHLEVAASIRSELVSRWYEATSAGHGEFDPFRAHLDTLLAREAERLAGVRRLTYTRSLDADQIRIWALCDDGTEAKCLESLEQHLGDELKTLAALYEPDLQWLPICARSAAGRGPAEDLASRFATLDELFESRSPASSVSSMPKPRWFVTRTARTRIDGHERTLGVIANRLAWEVDEQGYDVLGFSLTAHVSHESTSDEVLLELDVAGLSDAAARIDLWGHLSDSLSTNTDSFVIERLAIAVRSID